MVNFSADFRKIIVERGDKVLIQSSDCKKFLVSHKNCEGCSSELGCAKLVNLMCLVSSNRKPSEFVSKIVDATSAKELRHIFD